MTTQCQLGLLALKKYDLRMDGQANVVWEKKFDQIGVCLVPLSSGQQTAHEIWQLPETYHYHLKRDLDGKLLTLTSAHRFLCADEGLSLPT